MIENSDVHANPLIGRWTTDPNDKESLLAYGRTSLVFEPDGNLTYVIHGGKKDEVILLTYRIEGGFIVTDQPTASKEEFSAFNITPEGILILEFGGTQSRYIRVR